MWHARCRNFADRQQSMTNLEINQQAINQNEDASADLPAHTHIVVSKEAKALNKALLEGFLKHQLDSDIKRSHLFNDRYENIYLTSVHIPQIRDLLEQACDHARRILHIEDLQAGCWFNYMPPGAVTTVHRHDDDDELLSAVYYVSIPANSGNLIIHDDNTQHIVTPQQGMFVFFAPDVVHEVSENMSADDRLSIGINFGKRKHADN